ncbi:MAG: glycolate oxidase subunit GlcF [Gammaproteobacteria bacterium]|nr:glycolate oxidase subunit GlcF [Gammaproteobacteria bacterium]
MRAILTEGLLPPQDQTDAQAILRACVHCGFCNATCPSYQVLGDERDGPRGRIYLMKSLLEGATATSTTQTHLDRCLGCRACETTCPSGVQYTRLLDLVRPQVESIARRSLGARVLRRVLRSVVPHRRRFGMLLSLGRVLRPLLPRKLRRLVPIRQPARAVTYASPVARRFALLEGCVQETAAPEINQAAEEVFARVEIGLERFPRAGCCGALALHLGAHEEAANCARRNIDAWWPTIEAGLCEGVVAASSGCSQVLKDYGHLLRDDPAYATRAAALAAVAFDASEALPVATMPAAYQQRDSNTVVAFQVPCSLQHGLRSSASVATSLVAAGYSLVDVPESHLCCGSAGAYSLLQPEIAEPLLLRKLACLESQAPDVIATANIGCLLHLRKDAAVPVRHWLELLADRLAAGQ